MESGAIEPWERFQTLRGELRRLMEDTIGMPGWGLGLTGGLWQPPIDLHETDTELVLKADLPGIDENNLDIDVDEHLVTLKGEINRVQETKRHGIYRTERQHGSFQRTVSLPVPVNPEAAKAHYKNGVLEIRMPKREPHRGRKLQIDFT